MDLENFCIDRQVIKFCRLQDELVDWREKWFQCKSFCTPPNTNAIDLDTLYDELNYRTRLYNQSYPDD